MVAKGGRESNVVPYRLLLLTFGSLCKYFWKVLFTANCFPPFKVEFISFTFVSAERLNRKVYKKNRQITSFTFFHFVPDFDTN